VNKAASDSALRASRSRQLVWAAWATALLVTALSAAFLAFQVREWRHNQLQLVQMQARVLEDQTASTLAGTELILRSLQALAAGRGKAMDVQAWAALLTDNLRDRPFLRSLSLVDDNGRVLASSTEGNTGAQVPAAWRSNEVRRSGPARLLGLTAGRDLDQLSQVPLAEARALALPMVLPVESPQGPQLLVALINPDHFATQFDRMLGHSDLRALLSTMDGQFLAGTNEVRLPAGSSLKQLPAFTQFLPTRESGNTAGVGSDGQPALSAFRLLRNWPVLVLVEERDQPWRHLQELAWWVGSLLLLSWLLIGLGARVGSRSLRRDERLNLDLAKAHTATQASDSLKQAILQSSLDAIVTVDADGRVVDFNAAAEHMFGHQSAAILGLPMHELIVPPHHRAAHLAGMARYKATQVAHVLNRRLEIEAMRADGTLFPVELTIVPVRTETGQLFTATLRDITERQRVEQALRDSSALLDKTGRIGGIGGWEYDVATDTVQSTAESCRIHEIPMDTTGSLQATLAFYPPGARELVAAAVQRCLDSGEPFDLELPFVTARRRSLWVRVNGTAERTGERITRLVGALQDITERRRAQQELVDARQRELQVGARIQQSLLVTPTPPHLNGLQISSFSQASQGIDGDFVEVVRVGEHCVDIITGDVMGKGLPAAMMGAATKLQFSRSIAELLLSRPDSREIPRPADVVAAVHRAMTPALQALDAFVTLCYLRVDTQRHTVTWVGCGHEETLVVGQETITLLANQHPPLGVLDASDYIDSEQTLNPGDALFLCSDGVTDAIRSDGERVGRERVAETVARRVALHESPAAVLHAVRADLLATGVRMDDDVTMVVVQVPRGEEVTHRVELTPQLSSIKPLRAFVDSQLAGQGLEPGAAGLICVASVEAFTNIVRHATGLLEGSPVEVLARRLGPHLELDLVYLGDAFRPPEEPPKITLDTFPEGGFGLHIIHGGADRVDYLHHSGVNTLRLSKQLP
jgi:sigma-B regulation protein RsbU (phosphoserine phosphatase)